MATSTEHECSSEFGQILNISTLSMSPAYVFHFANAFPEFTEPEVESLAVLYGIDIQILDEYSKDCPFKKYRNMTLSDIKMFAKRSVSLRSVYEHILEGDNFTQVLNGIPNILADNPDRHRSYKITIEAFNRTYSVRTQAKLDKIDQLATALDMSGPVNLRNPEVIYTLLEYYGPHGSPSPDEPVKLYFARHVTDSCREADLRKFSIKTRTFIGNTSMDPTLSFLMANMARVGRCSLVLDPFVGTGSLLLACAHHGAYVVGADINKVLLYGRGRSSRHKKKWREKDENVRANFRQYKLESRYLDVIVADASKHNLWALEGLVDAIVTDPPYGIREQTKKLEAPSADVKKPHFLPPTAQYNLSEVFTDLLTLASRCLRLGGRIVYWLPIYRPDYSDDNIPAHPCFKLLYNCEQVLSTNISRRLITAEKVLEPHQVQECQLTQVSHKDHYSESFRDRYFQVTDQTETKLASRMPDTS